MENKTTKTKVAEGRKVYAWSLTVEDYNRLHEMAAERGMSISQYLREHIFPSWERNSDPIEPWAETEEQPKVEPKSSKKAPSRKAEPVDELPTEEEEVIVFEDNPNE